MFITARAVSTGHRSAARDLRRATVTAVTATTTTAVAVGSGGPGDDDAEDCSDGDGRHLRRRRRRCHHRRLPSAWRRSRHRRRHHLRAYGWAGGRTDRTETTAWRGVERLRKRCSRSRPFHKTLLRHCRPARRVRAPSRRGGGVSVALAHGEMACRKLSNGNLNVTRINGRMDVNEGLGMK
jgi:hypothetical protein